MKSILIGLSLLALLVVPFSVSAQKAALGKEDASLLRKMGEADLAEVELGKLAGRQASSAKVKEFAQHMVDEHGKGMKEGESLAQSKGVQLPAAPSKKHQDAMKKLESLQGDEFDRAYMREMVKGHQEVLKMVQGGAKSAKDADIKAAAQKKVPVVQEHLDMAKTTVAELGGGKASASGSSSKKASKEAK